MMEVPECGLSFKQSWEPLAVVNFWRSIGDEQPPDGFFKIKEFTRTFCDYASWPLDQPDLVSISHELLAQEGEALLAAFPWPMEKVRNDEVLGAVIYKRIVER